MPLRRAILLCLAGSFSSPLLSLLCCKKAKGRFYFQDFPDSGVVGNPIGSICISTEQRPNSFWKSF